MAPQMNQSLEANGVSNHTSNSYHLPNFNQSVKLKYVKLWYHYIISNFLYIMLVPLIFMVLSSMHMNTSKYSIYRLVQLSLDLVKCNLVIVFVYMALLVLFGSHYFMSRPKKVYLVNFTCYKPDSEYKVTKEIIIDRMIKSEIFSQENIDFQRKILERSGLGQETYLPTSLTRIPPNPCMAEARYETELVMLGAIDELLAKTKVNPRDIGILVVNCSLFSPTPSLTSVIVKHYNLRDNVLSYNLGGMGCSASFISLHLAKELLLVHDNTYALVVCTENITQNCYIGSERSMLVSNCLFRMGGAAILLSNNPSDYQHSKYQLMQLVRTHKGSDNKSYNCAYHREDDNNIIGAFLSRDLVAIAGEALKANITTLGPLVLPVSEQLLFFVMLIARKVFKMKIKPYIPDFKLAFEHFCIHAGGRAVLDEMEKKLELSPWHMEPSRMTLYRYGNTSSSSLWYELAYTEAKGRIKRGQRIWQVGFGAGFMCNSAVWKALKTVNPAKEKNVWMDEIDKFPVHVPKIDLS